MTNLVKKVIAIVFMVSIATISQQAMAATYYIDFATGNDTNTGTSQAAPWKTIPGTRNTTDSSDKSTYWGPSSNPVFNSSKKVPAGTVFKLKSGTTHDLNNGGKINISGTYYATNATFANPILFQRDTNWGNGSVTLDGNGISVSIGGYSGFGLIHVTVGGVSFDGVSGVTNAYDGLIIKNSTDMGISNYTSSELEGGTVQYVKFFNNGTRYLTPGVGPSFSGSGQLYFAWHNNVKIDWCDFDGNNLATQGLQLGQTNQRVRNAVVSNSNFYNHNGTELTWVGRGVVAQNSQVTFINCTAWNNKNKGFDPGNDGTAATTLTWDITYKFINCLAYNNLYGINFSNVGMESNAWTGAVKFYLINCILRDNTTAGSKSYAGPYNLYIVHSTFYNNGVNLLVARDGMTDLSSGLGIHAYIYNNIFYKPSGNSGNVDHPYWSDTSEPLVVDSDYNAYIQRSTEYFKRFGSYGGGNPHDFSYGINGPGHSSGSWYNFKTWYNDVNSKGTGALDSTMPPFKNLSNYDFTLTAHYLGTNLSLKPWYISEMGTDRNGVTRNSWDMGAYEFQSETILIPPTMKAPI